MDQTEITVLLELTSQRGRRTIQGKAPYTVCLSAVETEVHGFGVWEVLESGNVTVNGGVRLTEKVIMEHRLEGR